MFHTFEIGSLQATVLSDGFLTLPPPETVFPHLPPGVAQEAVGGTGGVVVQLNCLLLDMGGRRLLFDCGLGETRLWGADSGLLPRSMAEAGIDPATVDAVVLTHGHTDHCWGAVDGAGTPVFPNAEIHLSRAEFDHWTANPAASEMGRAGFARAILPMRDRIRFVAEGAEPWPGVSARSTPGHTPGHMSYFVASGGETACVVGDAIFHPTVSYRFPGTSTPYDLDPAVAAASRAALLRELAGSGTAVISYHAGWPGRGRVERDGAAYRFVPAAAKG